MEIYMENLVKLGLAIRVGGMIGAARSFAIADA